LSTQNKGPTGSPKRSSSHGWSSSQPRCPADLAATSALAATHEQRAAPVIESGFGRRERFLYAQGGAPEDYDQATQASAVRVVAGRAHHGDDLFDFGRIGGIAETLVPRRSTRMEAGHCRRRSASTGAVKQHLGHRPSSRSENEAEHPPEHSLSPKQQRDGIGQTDRRLPPLAPGGSDRVTSAYVPDAHLTATQTAAFFSGQPSSTTR
jgi:hypothetical protein